MTYCAAIRLKDGMVFASDTRTNAGIDHISTFKKLYQYGIEGERFIVLQTSGSLATSQAVFTKLQNDIDNDIEINLNTVETLFEAAQMVGECMRNVMNHARQVADATEDGGFTSSFMLGGQIKGQSSELYKIYSLGNCIKATEDTPFFQLGESKYGKPILDRSIDYDTDVRHAARALMLSFDSTIRSNLSVGMPIDCVLYENDSLHLPKGHRIDEYDGYFNEIRQQWSEALRKTLIELPKCPEGYWD